MLRNVIVHIANEQPFMADLVNHPSPSDVCLICRNMRTMNGKKPVYVDFADSTFVLPIAQVRFIEIPATSYAEADSAVESILPVRALPAPQLRGKRPKTAPAASRRVGSLAPRPEAEPDLQPQMGDDSGSRSEDEADAIVLLGGAYDTELDADLLRRIREA